SLFASPVGRLSVGSMVAGHWVMVGVMTMTPLHLKAGDHNLEIIGFVISLHIIGMYAASPVVGWLTDRITAPPVMAMGGVILFIGAQMTANTPIHESDGIFWGLFLIGLGWSFGLVASSALLAVTFDGVDRVRVQGLADLSMTTAGALAGVSAGLVVAATSFETLSNIASLVGLLPIFGFAALMVSQRKARSAA
ncbi:MAG: MFS transporter, partial [Actinobacteria bacterium]|nr:MFS transporter [Actinomycetota bacterium]